MKSKCLLTVTSLMLFSISGCSIKPVQVESSSEPESEQSSQNTPSESTESQLPNEVGNPHYLDLGELRDYSEVADKYNMSFIRNNNNDLIGYSYNGYRKYYTDSQGEICNGYVREYNDSFYDQQDFNLGNCYNLITTGRIGDHIYSISMEQTPDNGEKYYYYQCFNAPDSGRSVIQQFSIDAGFDSGLQNTKKYIETKDFVYIVISESMTYESYYMDTSMMFTYKCTNYIELFKTGKISGLYSVVEYTSDHNLDTLEVDLDGFTYYLGDFVDDFVFGERVDYPNKQEFIDSIPDTIVSLDSIDISYRQCTFEDYSLSDTVEHDFMYGKGDGCIEGGKRLEKYTFSTTNRVVNPYVYVAIEEASLNFRVHNVKPNDTYQVVKASLDLDTLKNVLGGTIEEISGKQYLLLMSDLQFKFRIEYDQLTFPVEYSLTSGWPEPEISSIAYRTLSHYQGMLQRSL